MSSRAWLASALALTLSTLASSPANAEGGQYASLETAKASQSVETRGQPAATAPNVVLVLVDTLRRDRLGVYGHSIPTTPFLDRLAADAIVFENAYSQAPQTFISTATLLTSSYFPLLVENKQYEPLPNVKKRQQRDLNRTPSLAAQNLTLAEELQRSGYVTFAAFTNPHHHPTSGFSQGFDRAPYLYPLDASFGTVEGNSVNQEFFRWLESKDESRPLFAYLHYMDVHHPYSPPPKYEEMFVTAKGTYKYVSGVPEGDLIPNATDLLYAQQLYDGEIRYVDDLVREIFETLRDRERPLVLIFASDHGDEFLDHGGLGHGRTMEKEMLHVPLIAYGLDPAQKGLRVQKLVRNIDIAPTILDRAGIPIPEVIEGTSLMQSLSPAQIGEDPSLTELPADGWSFGRRQGRRSVTSQRWHFILRDSIGGPRLYDNFVDPRGHTNLVSNHPEVVEAFSALTKSMARRENESERVAQLLDEAPQEATLDPTIESQLRALGYVDGEP